MRGPGREPVRMSTCWPSCCRCDASSGWGTSRRRGMSRWRSSSTSDAVLICQRAPRHPARLIPPGGSTGWCGSASAWCTTRSGRGLSPRVGSGRRRRSRTTRRTWINVALELLVKASLELPAFSTLDAMAGRIRREVNEGWRIDRAGLSHLSPYITERIKRFGEYATDGLTIPPAAFDAHLDLLATATAGPGSMTGARSRGSVLSAASRSGSRSGPGLPDGFCRRSGAPVSVARIGRSESAGSPREAGAVGGPARALAGRPRVCHER